MAVGTHQSEDLLRAYPRYFEAALTRNARRETHLQMVRFSHSLIGNISGLFSCVRFYVLCLCGKKTDVLIWVSSQGQQQKPFQSMKESPQK